MAGTATLICPKCRGEMSTYERNGAQIDQCDECRGIFVDRGELEQLIDAAIKSGGLSHSPEVEAEHSHEHGDRSHRRRRGSATSLISEFLGGGD